MGGRWGEVAGSRSERETGSESLELRLSTVVVYYSNCHYFPVQLSRTLLKPQGPQHGYLTGCLTGANHITSEPQLTSLKLIFPYLLNEDNTVI